MPSGVSHCVDVTTERWIQGGRVCFGKEREVVVAVRMEGGGRELLARGLVHHRSGAISCNIHHLTQENLRLTSGGGILHSAPHMKMQTQIHGGRSLVDSVNDFYGTIWLPG